jgi:predicted hotdog family 3-hydroxylacyl-ACP dehydratase
MAAEPIAQFPDLDALLPHRTPMRFVTGIVDMAERSLISSVEIPASCPLVHAGYTPVLVGIEAAAQTAATWEALRRWRETGNAAPRIGYLVTLRDLMFYTEQLPAGESMRVSVCLEALAPPLTHYRVELTRDGRTLLRGTIATYLSNGMPQLVPPEIPDSPGNDL